MAIRESLLTRIVRRSPLRWHVADRLTRMQLIQHAVDALSARTYLEIGVDEGIPFSRVRAPIKIGVDPIAAQPLVKAELQRQGSSYFSTTSDQFFARHAPQLLSDGVDVAFIDGLHTYEQTDRDIRNVLNYLNPGGIVLVHDCLPASAQEACVASSYEEAGRINGAGWNGLWTGDGWKSVVAVRAGHTPAHAVVLDTDHGVGVVYRATQPAPLSLSLAAIDALDYDTLRRNREELLGLCRAARLRDILRQLRGQRRAK
jgi:hypothetical protein